MELQCTVLYIFSLADQMTHNFNFPLPAKKYHLLIVMLPLACPASSWPGWAAKQRLFPPHPGSWTTWSKSPRCQRPVPSAPWGRRRWSQAAVGSQRGHSSGQSRGCTRLGSQREPRRGRGGWAQTQSSKKPANNIKLLFVKWIFHCC